MDSSYNKNNHMNKLAMSNLENHNALADEVNND